MYKASTTLSLDLCPEIMSAVVGQALFLFHISQHFLPISEGIRFWKIKIKMRQVSFHIQRPSAQVWETKPNQSSDFYMPKHKNIVTTSSDVLFY